MSYQAEYIWIDGTEPTALLRSKTKIIADGAEPGIWGFDGSSTSQAEGHDSDCVLQPVCVVPDPIRKGKNVLVLAEVLLTDMTPHPSNTRAKLREVYEQFKDQDPWFGIEQEYTLFKGARPLGFPENGGYPGPQGPYYCGVGQDDIYGRPLVEAHMTACLEAGLLLSGINAEVMPGQWEFQIGAGDPLTVSDHLWLGRWLLHRLGEEFAISVTLDPKPARGDWNGAGAHTNFSTNKMREDYDAVVAACEALGKNADEHIANYGFDIESRLTGAHETAHYSQFNYGVSNRGASVRIPWQVAIEKKGYIEDRRPNANMDPYVVTRLIVNTCCSALAN